MFTVWLVQSLAEKQDGTPQVRPLRSARHQAAGSDLVHRCCTTRTKKKPLLQRAIFKRNWTKKSEETNPGNCKVAQGNSITKHPGYIETATGFLGVQSHSDHTANSQFALHLKNSLLTAIFRTNSLHRQLRKLIFLSIYSSL